MTEPTTTPTHAAPDPDEAALLDILETGGDGPTYIAALDSVDGGPDTLDITEAADSPQFVARLMEWHRGGTERRTAALESQLAQLRHVIDNQAQKLESYALQHIADAKRIVELEAAFGVTPDCKHGSGWQYVSCVPDDGVSFRFQPLGGNGSAS